MWMTYLLRQTEIRIHFYHFPAAITILIDAYQQIGIIFLTPINIKMSSLGVAWDDISNRDKLERQGIITSDL